MTLTPIFKPAFSRFSQLFQQRFVVTSLTHDELTGQWNATIIEPSVTMCPPFVRLIRRLFAESPALCMCKVQWVASHAQQSYGMYCKRLGYAHVQVCRHLTLFLAHRWLHGKSIQYQSIAATDVERPLHRPFYRYARRCSMQTWSRCTCIHPPTD